MFTVTALELKPKTINRGMIGTELKSETENI
jgi:hypothetical protein